MGIALVLLNPQIRSQESKRFDNYLNEVYENHVIPGFSVVVVNDRGIIYQKGFGKERIDLPAPFTEHTVSAIGSLTKSMTVMAVMQLVEQGSLELDTAVINYLPWFGTANKEKSDKITVRMLINNTSGLQAHPHPAYDLSDGALEKLTRDLEGSFITREPGTKYEYSNVAFSVAGCLVAKVSGLPFKEYLKTRIFDPLRMKNTSTDPSIFEDLRALEGHFLGIDFASPALREKQFESGEFIPAGSFTRSTAEDLGNYLIALLNQGKFGNSQVLSPESIRQMWTSNSSFPGLSLKEGGDDKPIHYGLGWMISDIEGRHVIHHGGSTGKMSSMTMIDQTNKLAVSFLANIDLTFIDQYQHLTIYHIVNNILHIAAGQSATEFGIPVVSDPSINDFELEPDVAERYVGEFRQVRGGDDWVNFGLILNLKKSGRNDLKAIVSRGKNTVHQLALDFASPTLAIGRSSAIPKRLNFILSPDGEVKGLFCDGVEYIKVNKELIRNYRKYNLEDDVSLLLPNHWQVQELNNGITAMDPNNSKLRLRLYLKESADIDACQESESVLFQGPWFNQMVGQYIWQHRSVVTSSKNGTEVCSAFKSKIGQTPVYFDVTSENQDHTLILQQHIMTMLNSLQIEK